MGYGALPHVYPSPCPSAPEWQNGKSCQPCLSRFSHPNDMKAETASSARAAANHFARRRMLAQPLPIAPPRDTCSHRMCLLLARSCGGQSHPNDGNVEAVSPARGAVPECWNGVTCYLCTRRWQPVCQKTHARTVSAYRTNFLSALPHFYIPVKGVWGLGPHD